MIALNGFAAGVHPTVRGDLIECLEEKRREDECEAREDRDFEQTLRPDIGRRVS